MSVSTQELLPPPVKRCGELEVESLRVPVEWSTTSFECGIRRQAGPGPATPRAQGIFEPVLLRVTGAGAESCRVALFCVATGLCGASAGW